MTAAHPAGSPPLLVIAGATATGKTGLAIETAEALAGEGIVAEVISADSRQVFRGLDIGTAKASLAERRGIIHHGLDLVDPDVPFSVADFADHARAVLAALAARDGLAILAGGTGLYLRAVARGIATDRLPADAAVRARLEAEFLAVGLDPLVERLRADAPDRAAGLGCAVGLEVAGVPDRAARPEFARAPGRAGRPSRAAHARVAGAAAHHAGEAGAEDISTGQRGGSGRHPGRAERPGR